MRIEIYDMIDGGWFMTDISKTNKRRLAYNLANLWAWNNIDKQRENNDGECIYIDFGETQ